MGVLTFRSMTLAYCCALLAFAMATRSVWLLNGGAAVLSITQFTSGCPRMAPLLSTYAHFLSWRNDTNDWGVFVCMMSIVPDCSALDPRRRIDDRLEGDGLR